MPSSATAVFVASAADEGIRAPRFTRTTCGPTRPVGYLPPQDCHTETPKLAAFQTFAALPCQPENRWRTPPEAANRPLLVDDATGEATWTWNHRFGCREMGEKSESAH